MNTYEELSADQQRLVQEKTSVLVKARQLQADLATARADLAKFDVEMLRAGFKMPVVACW